jgi:hypothetical protein
MTVETVFVLAELAVTAVFVVWFWFAYVRGS